MRESLLVMNATTQQNAAPQFYLTIGVSGSDHCYGSMSLDAARETIGKHSAQFQKDLSLCDFDHNGIARIKMTTRPNPEQNHKGGVVINYGFIGKK
jgi:hypothetical protein